MAWHWEQFNIAVAATLERADCLSGKEKKRPHQKVKTPKGDLNDSSGTEYNERDNVLKSGDKEAASIKHEDKNKQEEEQTLLTWKFQMKFVWTGENEFQEEDQHC